MACQEQVRTWSSQGHHKPKKLCQQLQGKEWTMISLIKARLSIHTQQTYCLNQPIWHVRNHCVQSCKWTGRKPTSEFFAEDPPASPEATGDNIADRSGPRSPSCKRKQEGTAIHPCIAVKPMTLARLDYRSKCLGRETSWPLSSLVETNTKTKLLTTKNKILQFSPSTSTYIMFLLSFSYGRKNGRPEFPRPYPIFSAKLSFHDLHAIVFTVSRGLGGFCFWKDFYKHLSLHTQHTHIFHAS